jgi:hypothetical protein
MTHGIIGIRNDREFTQVFGPAPIAEVMKEYKDRVAADLDAGGDGLVHGVLEVFELRAARRHKIRNAGEEEEKAEPETPNAKGRKRAAHSE